jgi:hypothetical protein
MTWKESASVRVGSLVRFWTPALPQARSDLGLVIGIRLDNLSVTGLGEIYDVLTPDDGILCLTAGALEPVQPT